MRGVRRPLQLRAGPARLDGGRRRPQPPQPHAGARRAAGGGRGPGAGVRPPLRPAVVGVAPWRAWWPAPCSWPGSRTAAPGPPPAPTTVTVPDTVTTRAPPEGRAPAVLLAWTPDGADPGLAGRGRRDPAVLATSVVGGGVVDLVASAPPTAPWSTPWPAAGRTRSTPWPSTRPPTPRWCRWPTGPRSPAWTGPGAAGPDLRGDPAAGTGRHARRGAAGVRDRRRRGGRRRHRRRELAVDRATGGGPRGGHAPLPAGDLPGRPGRRSRPAGGRASRRTPRCGSGTGRDAVPAPRRRGAAPGADQGHLRRVRLPAGRRRPGGAGPGLAGRPPRPGRPAAHRARPAATGTSRARWPAPSARSSGPASATWSTPRLRRLLEPAAPGAGRRCPATPGGGHRPQRRQNPTGFASVQDPGCSRCSPLGVHGRQRLAGPRRRPLRVRGPTDESALP